MWATEITAIWEKNNRFFFVRCKSLQFAASILWLWSVNQIDWFNLVKSYKRKKRALRWQRKALTLFILCCVCVSLFHFYYLFFLLRKLAVNIEMKEHWLCENITDCHHEWELTFRSIYWFFFHHFSSHTHIHPHTHSIRLDESRNSAFAIANESISRPCQIAW